MKMKNYLRLVQRHPFVADDMTRIFGNDPRERVRTEVEYIAFRPFETLDLNAKSTPLHKFTNTGVDEHYEHVTYCLVYHVEDESAGEHQMYAVFNSFSIEGQIESIMRMFEGHAEYATKQMVWERVIKRVTRGTHATSVQRNTFEVYLFPQHYRFRPIDCRPAPCADRAHMAYLTDGPFPPIIPRTLSFSS